MSPARNVYHPTPAEIRRTCRAIQGSWSPEERRNRALGRVDDLTVPWIGFELLMEEIANEAVDV